MADRSNPRYLMGFGLILTGLFNIFFGLSSSVLVFAIFWGLNGWFQGWGWPPCNRLLTHWYSQKERGRWWGAWNTSHSVGGALIPIIVADPASRCLDGALRCLSRSDVYRRRLLFAQPPARYSPIPRIAPHRKVQR